VAALDSYKMAKKSGDTATAGSALAVFNQYKDDLGYGYLNNPEEAAPPVALTFYAFHIMVGLGTLFPIIFLAVLFFAFRGTLDSKRWLWWVCFACLFLGYLASQAGWVVAEVGRQPWAIQGLLPVGVAGTNIAASSVQLTFFIFLALFTALLIADIGIMVKQIKIGPEA
jgi:cytochrome d ubiquinol oxidase subunit I